MVNPFLWAKKRESNGRFLWLPLKQHLEDTRRVIDRLWEHWLNDAQRHLVIHSLDNKNPETAKQLVQFLGATHDIAKGTAAFQVQTSFPLNQDLDKELVEKLEKAGFKEVSTAQLPQSNKSPHALAGQAMLSWYGVNEDIASIIGAHHGKPIETRKLYKDQSSYEENYYQNDRKNDEIYKKWKQTQKDIFTWALNTSGFDSVKDLPNISQPGQVILSGLLIMADWIASNEFYFPLIGIDTLEVGDQDARFLRAWEEWDKSSQWSAENIDDINKLYENRFGFKAPRDVQAVLSEVIKESDHPGIYILEAPMGVGKTEAALVGVEQLAYKSGQSGLFFGLPTQATSDGIFPRINEWLTKVSEESDEDTQLSIRLAHGKSELNEEFSGIARNIDIDSQDKGSVFVNEWFKGRKQKALDDFVIGTVDQFLMAALKQKHLALRHLGFSKKIVVLDEVHSFDSYMSVYLEGALNWMGAYGVPVIILSATLASDIRRSLIRSYLEGSGVRIPKEFSQDDKFKTDAYPLITYTDNDEVYQVREFETEERKTVKVNRIEEEELHSLIDNLSQGDGIIGVVVNTVRRAQELARYCVSKYGEDRVELLHSSFVATDRKQRERKLLNMIGKDVQRPKKKIIIGTQVIEQSLDINFDALISDLAPMDLLIQRVGRLHRHDIKYPHHFSEPTLYVIGTSERLEFESGSQAVYGDYLLARTQYFLEDSIDLPDDISPLVQKVYSDLPLELTKDLEIKFESMKKKHIKLIKSKKRKAEAFKVDFPDHDIDPSINLIGWLNSSAVDKESLAQAQVRDIRETIEVIALKRINQGYGIIGSDTDISGMIMDNNIAREVSQQTLRLPNVLSYPNVIDKTIDELEKFTLKKLPYWQEQPWLNGLVGIIFDENNQFRLNGSLLTYDPIYGLTYEKEGKE